MAFFRKMPSLDAKPELIGPRFVQDLRREQNLGPSIEQEAAYIGRGCRIVGESHFRGSIRIDGEVQGTLTANDCITIGETGLVTTTAPICAETVIVAGAVRADVRASGRIEIQASARVWGNLTAPNLKIESGAFLDSHCLTLPADGSNAYPPVLAVRHIMNGPEGLHWSVDEERTRTSVPKKPR